MFRMDDRVALVSGAARGVGRGVALALARRGARLVLNDIESEGRIMPLTPAAFPAPACGPSVIAVGSVFDSDYPTCAVPCTRLAKS